MRATFDPYAGPAQLIFAFEAAVIGGRARCGARWSAASSSASRRRSARRSIPQWLSPRRPPASSWSCCSSAPGGGLVRASRSAAHEAAAITERRTALPVARGRPSHRVRSPSPRRSLFAPLLPACSAPRRQTAHRRCSSSHPRRRCGTRWPATAAWSRSASRRSSASAPTPRSGSPSGRQPLPGSGAAARSSSARLAADVAFVLRLRGGEFAIGMWVIAEVSVCWSTSTSRVQRRHRHLADCAQRYAPADAPAPTPTGWRWLRDDRPAGAGLRAAAQPARRRRSRRSATTRTPPHRSACASLRTKRLLFVLAAFGCGAAGALWLANTLTIQPELIFSVQWTAYMIFMVLVGGIGTFEGPILGAIIFFLIETGSAAPASGTWSASAPRRSSSRCSCRAASGAPSRTASGSPAAAGRLHRARAGGPPEGRGAREVVR